MSIESVMPSTHLILCCPLLLLPPIPLSIRVFSNELILCMRWPKYCHLMHQSIQWTPIDNYQRHQPKDIDWVGRRIHVHLCNSIYHITLPDSPNCMQLFYIVRLIIIPLWLVIIIIFYFLSGSWLWKPISIFCYCDYVTTNHLRPLYHDGSTEK